MLRRLARSASGGDRDSDRHVEHGQRPAGEAGRCRLSGEPELLPDGFRGAWRIEKAVRDIERVHNCQGPPATYQRVARRRRPPVPRPGVSIIGRGGLERRKPSLAPGPTRAPPGREQAAASRACPGASAHRPDRLAAPVASPWAQGPAPRSTHTSSTTGSPVAADARRSSDPEWSADQTPRLSAKSPAFSMPRSVSDSVVAGSAASLRNRFPGAWSTRSSRNILREHPGRSCRRCAGADWIFRKNPFGRRGRRHPNRNSPTARRDTSRAHVSLPT